MLMMHMSTYRISLRILAGAAPEAAAHRPPTDRPAVSLLVGCGPAAGGPERLPSIRKAASRRAALAHDISLITSLSVWHGDDGRPGICPG